MDFPPSPRTTQRYVIPTAPWTTALAGLAMDLTPKVSKILLVEPVGVDARRGMHGKKDWSWRWLWAVFFGGRSSDRWFLYLDAIAETLSRRASSVIERAARKVERGKFKAASVLYRSSMMPFVDGFYI